MGNIWKYKIYCHGPVGFGPDPWPSKDSKVCFSSTEPFRFVVPKTGDYGAPPPLSSFWIMKNFQLWEVGKGLQQG